MVNFYLMIDINDELKSVIYQQNYYKVNGIDDKPINKIEVE